MKIAITGSSGLVGSALVPLLTNSGHDVVRLARPAVWDPSADTVHSSAIHGAEAIVHLAAENIAAGRWTTVRKALIRDSRVKGTKLIADAITKMERPPQVLVSASAIGYYGDRGAEVLREDSAPGQGFLPDV